MMATKRQSIFALSSFVLGSLSLSTAAAASTTLAAQAGSSAVAPGVLDQYPDEGDDAAPESAEPEASAGGEASLGTPSAEPAAAASTGAATTAEKPFRKWRPRGFMVELGVYGGILMVDEKHEFWDIGAATKGAFRVFPRVVPEFGLRFGLYGGGFFGAEIEAALAPTRFESTALNLEDTTLFWLARGHLVFQIPAANLVPFVLAGVGTVAVTDGDPKNQDADLAVHFGGGLKLYMSKYTALRLDLRDVVMNRRGKDNELKAHNLEALLGLSITFGRKDAPLPPPPPADTDRDGILDRDDQCPTDPETYNDFMDADGCPEEDRDSDGFWNVPDQDACPDEAGVEPDGCPIRDTDGDGILDPDDECPQEPETKNGYQDADGCPDEVPKEIVDTYSGVIQGINFELNSANITPESSDVLDRAVELLKQYNTLALQVVGHTDSQGKDSYNLDLSQQRADSVRAYFVSRGISASRLSTRGAGEAEPIASNKTKQGRAQNRRIEFKISQ